MIADDESTLDNYLEEIKTPTRGIFASAHDLANILLPQLTALHLGQTALVNSLLIASTYPTQPADACTSADRTRLQTCLLSKMAFSSLIFST